MWLKHMPSVYLHRNIEVYPIGANGYGFIGREGGGEGEGEGKREKRDKLLKFQTTSHYDLN